MATGMNALRLRGTRRKATEIREEIEAIKEAFWTNYRNHCDMERGFKVNVKIKKVDFAQFENTLQKLENDLWYAEEEERIRRNWK
jgi:hypothetical protein